jgi:Winged helix-turn helix
MIAPLARLEPRTSALVMCAAAKKVPRSYSGKLAAMSVFWWQGLRHERVTIPMNPPDEFAPHQVLQIRRLLSFALLMLNIQDLKAAYEKAIGHATSNSTVYNLLARRGWRKLMPRPFHPKRDLAAQNAFKKTVFQML